MYGICQNNICFINKTTVNYLVDCAFECYLYSYTHPSNKIYRERPQEMSCGLQGMYKVDGQFDTIVRATRPMLFILYGISHYLSAVVVRCKCIGISPGIDAEILRHYLFFLYAVSYYVLRLFHIFSVREAKYFPVLTNGSQ